MVTTIFTYLMRIFTYLILLLSLFSISVLACSIPGYEICTEQNMTFDDTWLYTKVAFSIKDERGLSYWDFHASSFAVGGMYVNVYYEGDELWYLYNLSNWSDACTPAACAGILLNGSGYYQLASLGDEYIGCPAFVSVTYGLNNYVWVGGAYYLKPLDNTCCHIRIVRCLTDDDCGLNEYCNKTGHWRNWSCQIRERSVNLSEEIPEIDETITYPVSDPIYLGGNYLSFEDCYVPNYNRADLNNIVVDVVTTPLAAFIKYIDIIFVALVVGFGGFIVIKLFKK